MGALSGSDTVVITGIGLRTGLGPDRETTWDAMKAGRSAARWLERVPAPANESPYCAYPRLHPDSSPDVHLLKAAMEAVSDAKLALDDRETVDRRRIGVVVGFSKGNVRTLGDWLNNKTATRFAMPDPVYFSWLSPGGLAARFSNLWDFQGPCLAPIAACATGLIALIQGADLIRRHLCDVVMVGAGDSPLEPMILAAFRKMRAFAHVSGEPTTALRPWDRKRSGFLPGEGGAILILERASHAKGRGVLPYAEVGGGAFGSDAYHMTDLNPDPSSLTHWITRALHNSEASTSDIDHINVHGTATRQNDPLECRAIRRAFGPHADSISCSANKAQIGHMLGAAGAAELAITCLAIRDGFVSPTLNLDDPDPACDLDGTPHVGRSREIRAAMKISIGFGGHLAAAVLRKPDGPRRMPRHPAPSSDPS